MINHQFTVMAKKNFKDFFVKLLLFFIFHHGWRYYILCWQSDLQTEPFIHLILCFRVNTRESHAHVARLSSFIHIYIHVQIWIKDVQKHRKCCNIRKKKVYTCVTNMSNGHVMSAQFKSPYRRAGKTKWKCDWQRQYSRYIYFAEQHQWTSAA